MLMLAGVVVAGVVLFLQLGPIPIPKELPTATVASSQVYAADGTPITTWHGPINRIPVPLAQISKYLPTSVVAEEDTRYYSDPGVDARSVLRAAIDDLKAGHIVEGGSTITQQYVKDAYVGSRPSLARKMLEARVALQLTRTLSKDEIMDRYLNTVYFGDGAYGAEAVARTYFGESASSLTISEAALLAGIIHSPSHDSPMSNPTAAEADRLRVIGRMETLGSISHAEAAAARLDRPVLVAPVPDNPQYAWFLDALRTDLISRYGAAKVYGGGLQIHATLDPSMQAAALSAIATALPDASDPYAAIVTIDPATGYVRAIVGGRDYNQEKFNIATMGRRQPGSAFKPFVLAAALEQGISPQQLYSGPSRLCLAGWTPGCVSNFDDESFGTISLLDATVYSVNTVYAQVILQVGPKRVAAVARQMGIPGPVDVVPPAVGCRPLGSDVCDTYLPPLPSLALGSASVTPLEMASAYATLAAGGVYRAPKLVSQVTDASGNVLDSGPSDPIQALPAPVAATETQILQQVIARGTGTAANIGVPAAGKTGTAQDYRNAWFVGYTPTLATAVWMGYRDSNQPLINVRGVPHVVGGTIPAAIWANYMKVAVDTDPPTLDVGSEFPTGAVTNQRAPTFTGTATDQDGDVVRLEASVDGEPWSVTGTTCSGCPGRNVTWGFQPAAPLADGTHTFAFRSADTGGHESPVSTRTVTVDTVPPKLTGLEATGGSASVTVAFSKPMLCPSLVPSDFAAAVAGRPALVSIIVCSGATSQSITFALGTRVPGGATVVLSGGTRATDRAGNHLTGSVNTTATNATPTISVTGATPGAALPSNRQPAYQGWASDPDGGVAGIEASIDGGTFGGAGTACPTCNAWAPVAVPVSWTWQAPVGLGDGPHTIALRAVDGGGATSQEVTQTVLINASPPVLEAVMAAPGSNVVSLVFSKPIACSTVDTGHLSVTVNGTPASIVLATCMGQADPVVDIALTKAPAAGDTVQVILTHPVADAVGNLTKMPTSQSGRADSLPSDLP